MMDIPTLTRLRLSNQFITHESSISPAEVVRQLGMVQAQDYLGALWAVGLRASNSTEAQVEQALSERKIVRTWPARGTLHFVTPEDVRWMLGLLTPRVIAGTRLRYKQLELDEQTFSKSRDVFTQILNGGNQLTREELYQAMQAANISPKGQRSIHIIGRLAQEGLLCFGPRVGKKHTFVLLDEWIPQGKSLDHEQALLEITLRYYTGHGPATVRDFAWWAGLSAADARAGIDLAQHLLIQEKVGDQNYWMTQSTRTPGTPASDVSLLPSFDEYLVGYTDRTAVLEPAFTSYINNGGGILHPAIVKDGMIIGTWKRTLQKKSVEITPSWFTPPTKDQEQQFDQAALKYATFLNLQMVKAG